MSLTSELRASPERQPADDESPLVSLPPEAIELIQWRSASIENRLGYFRDEPLVIFGYCPGGGEVITIRHWNASIARPGTELRLRVVGEAVAFPVDEQPSP